MRISLIAPNLFDLGLYTISPQLKTRGHSVKLLFLPALMQDSSRAFSSKTMTMITEFIKDSDMVGINCFSENYHKTVILVNHIKNTMKTPVVWGGIHATLKPEECIKHADIVCIGEGEEAIVELAEKLERKENPRNIKNLLFQSQSEYTDRPELRPPVDLNSLEPLDYDIDSQYVLENNKIRNVKEEDFKGTFLTYSSRGCPFRCSYCCNEFMLNLYKGDRYCRQRSTENIIKELNEIKSRFPSCKVIWFDEADFLSGKTLKGIEDFSKKYKREINIPFGVWSNPTAVTDEKIRALKDAGLKGINIGTISGNDKVQKEVFNRSATANIYRVPAEVLKKYDIYVEYDVILCNPYEDDYEIINTIHLLMGLPKPFRTVIYSLTYFPGTELYKKALKDGIVKENQHIESYTKAASKAWKFQNESTYMNVILSMMRGMARRSNRLGINFYGILPEPLLKVLVKNNVVKFFNRLPFKSFIYGIIAGFIMISYNIARKITELYRRFRAFFKKK